MSGWTLQCLRHADAVLMFASAEDSEKVTKMEEKIEGVSLRVTKELVLVHPATTEIPQGTRKWLEIR